MGAVSILVADGNIASLNNPAALVLIPRSAVTGGVNIDQVSEESFSKDEQVLDNNQNYLNPLRSQGFVIRNKEVFTAAVSRGMLCDYFTKREKIDEKTKESSSYESKGGLYTFSGSGAKQVVPKMAIGGGLNILRGDRDTESRYTKEKTSSSWTTEQTESGINVSLGALYTLTEQIKMGAVYKANAEITSKLTSTVIENGKKGETESIKQKWTYPASMGIGAAYKYEKTLFVGEIHRTNWSDYKWSAAGEAPTRPEYLNLTTFHLGLEYEASIPSISPEPLLLRAGFYTSPFHFLKELSTDETTGYFVTAGIGISIEDIRIDIAGQLGKKTFTEPEAERDYEASIKSILGTVSYQFDLF
jgi:long-subunit fatty acid transport protein